MFVRLIVAAVVTVTFAEALEAAPPSTAFDLSNWKLTIPYNTERKGNPDEVVQPELAEFDDASCFCLDQSGKVLLFTAPCDGVGTTNSKYPRSELREMVEGGDDEASWSTDDETLHVMEARLAITKVPAVRQHVVCAQIHDEEDDIIMIRLEEDELFVERGNLEEALLDPNYDLGKEFDLRIVAGQGRIEISYNGIQKLDWKTSKNGCYFKIGCYTQSNLEKENQKGSLGQVKLYQLSLSKLEANR